MDFSSTSSYVLLGLAAVLALAAAVSGGIWIHQKIKCRNEVLALERAELEHINRQYPIPPRHAAAAISTLASLLGLLALLTYLFGW